MITTYDFLSALYRDFDPDKTIYLFTVPGESTHRYRVTDLPEMADAAVNLSSQYEVYFGAGATNKPLNSPGRAKNIEVSAIPGLWVDIDVKDPTAHKKEALPPDMPSAMKLIPDELPPTFVVWSGYGLHVYWLFREPWDLDTPEEHERATQLSRALQATIKRRASDFKWELDPTADLARVLRLPGTINRKNPSQPVQVQVIEQSEIRFNPSDIEDLLPPAPPSNSPGQQREDKFKRKETDGPAQLMLNNCHFLKHCQEDAASIGYDEWLAMITNVARAADGIEKVHEVSALDPVRYNQEDTDRKITEALNNMNPQNCEYIQKVIGFTGCPESGCDVKAPCGWSLGKVAKARAVVKAIDKPTVETVLTNDILGALALLKTNDPLEYTKFKANCKGKINLNDLEKLVKQKNQEKEMDNLIPFPNKRTLPDYFKQTDYGYKVITPRLGEHIMKNENFLYAGEILHIYRNGFYLNKGTEIVRSKCQELTFDYFKKDLVNETTYYIETCNRRDPGELNNRPDLINVKNGLLDWRTGKLYPHTPKYLSTIQLPVIYDPKATCPATDKFWSEIVPADCLPILEEMFGYSMIPETKYQKAFMLTGGGSNGKGTLLDQLTSFIGRTNTSNVPLQDLAEHRFKRAEIFGKLINIFADLDSKALLSTSYFKMVVAGDEIDAERKHKDPFFFRPFSRLIFSANELPRSNDRTFAYYRRWIILSFPNKFVIGQNADNNLIKGITSEKELSGVLNRALNGLRRLDRQGGFSTSETVNNELEKYKVMNDSVAAFINDWCVVNLNDEDRKPIVGKVAIYDSYKRYVAENNLKQLSARKFNERLQELCPAITEERPTGGARMWVGIGLNDEAYGFN
ncbi:hypothetical protein JCM14036_02880 [Desulfotomaculum defluvii]